MAAPGIRGDSLLLLQQSLVGKVMGIRSEALKINETINRGAFDIVVNTNTNRKPALRAYLEKVLDTIPSNELPQGFVKDDNFISTQINTLTSPWMVNFLNYDPKEVLAKIDCPVLAINGTYNLQVPYKKNTIEIEGILENAGNKQLTTKAYPRLNHLFQESETGAPIEYAKIEQTIAPIVLQDIATWIQNQVKN